MVRDYRTRQWDCVANDAIHNFRLFCLKGVPRTRVYLVTDIAARSPDNQHACPYIERGSISEVVLKPFGDKLVAKIAWTDGKTPRIITVDAGTALVLAEIMGVPARIHGLASWQIIRSI